MNANIDQRRAGQLHGWNDLEPPARPSKESVVCEQR